MKRRRFNQLSGSLSTLLIISPASVFSKKRDPMERIGMSTVNFRNRFSSTSKSIPSGSELTLPDVPEYFADRFTLKNVELWSRHFESIGPAYLKDLKTAIKKCKSRLINIQMDEKYQIGDPDPVRRKESLELVLQWIDVAKALGSEGIRVNPGKGELAHAIESYKTINAAAKKKGIVLMIENHFGMAMDPNVHLKIVKEVGSNMYTLPDFGNYADEVRFDALRKIMPQAYQLSAKTVDFDQHMNHTTYDFDRCMKIAADSGFQGIYSVEQWSRKTTETGGGDEAMADWMIESVKPYCT